MELGSAFPAELLTAWPPAGGAAPGLQRRSAADADDGASVPAGFDLLLQMLLAQPPAGQPLPASGKDLPPSSPIPAAAASALTPALSEALSGSGPAIPADAPPVAGTPLAAAAPLTDGPVAALNAALAAARAAGEAIESAAPQASPAASAVRDSAPPIAAPTAAALPAGETRPLALAGGVPSAVPSALPSTVPNAVQAPAAAAAVDPAVAAATNPTASAAAATIAEPADARPRARSADAVAASRWTTGTATAGADAPSAPVAVDKAAALPPPQAAAAAQAAPLHVQRLDAPIPPALEPADPAAPGAAPLGHAAAHVVGPSAAPTSAPAAAAPGQAALAQTPVDTTAARWHEALASRVHWLVDHDVGEARIKLNPPELGALDVKISMQDDKTFVQVTAHTAAARDELTQSLPRLRDLLSAGGLQLGGATVSGGRDDRGTGRYTAAEPIRSRDVAGGIEPVFAARGTSAAARGLVDLFA
jgi:flagellar hook-length control protein FliK